MTDKTDGRMSEMSLSELIKMQIAVGGLSPAQAGTFEMAANRITELERKLADTEICKLVDRIEELEEEIRQIEENCDYWADRGRKLEAQLDAVKELPGKWRNERWAFAHQEWAVHDKANELEAILNPASNTDPKPGPCDSQPITHAGIRRGKDYRGLNW